MREEIRMTKRKPEKKMAKAEDLPAYNAALGEIAGLIGQARHSAARSANALMTATYWLIGQRIVEFEQGGEVRAEYGEALLEKLSADLTERFGRGFSRPNLQRYRQFYLTYLSSEICSTLSSKSSEEPLSEGKIQTVSGIPEKDRLEQIVQTPSGLSSDFMLPHQKFQTLSEELGFSETRQTASAESGLPEKYATLSAKFSLEQVARCFPLPWSHYVRLMSVKNPEAQKFYETEALRCGWSVRQLNRQISSQFYERTALSRNKAAMLKKGEKAQLEDTVTPEDEIKDPFVLEFLDLKDEYCENDLEEALIRHLESFLLELGSDFCFIGRQKRLRVGNAWYRVDLLFFHRKLRSLVVIDLKIGAFTHADAGQMHLYLNYARENWTHEGENPPVGLILCAEKDEAVAHYALEGLPNKVLAAEYRTALPDEKALVAEIERTRKAIETQARINVPVPQIKAATQGTKKTGKQKRKEGKTT
jgi:predicted nuclease of restriction endonuclease-like (RecB) superfamily